VSIGRYETSSGEATLMLISYPTPQLAAEHLRRIDAAHQMTQPQNGVSSIENAGSFFDKRTGPILVIATGPVSDSDAKSLLRMVNYEASVTWNTPTDNPQARDLYMLILNIVILCAIVGGLAVVAGVAFGGIRILMKRWYPDKIFDRPEQMEFISLHLTEAVVKGGTPSTSEAGRQAPQNPA
jgi:magnesium-transporting ATPase (P-type)